LTAVYKKKSLFRRIYDARTAYYLLLPNLVFFAAFVWFPILFSFALSFHRYGLGTPQFMGIQQYVRVLEDPRFWIALRNTLSYVMIMAPTSFVIGLGMALVLNQKFLKGKSFFRLASLIPYIVPLATISLVWMWLFEPNWGLINHILKSIRIPPLMWLSSTKLALVSVSIVEVWKTIGYYMILFLAGLQSIPAQYYEAAKIEGAGPWNSFRHITLPLLSHTTFFIVIIATIAAFKIFTSVYIMTQGGPADSTMSLVLLIYEYGFRYFKMGYASAIAFALLFVVLIIILIQVKLLQTETEYE
jgi:multiple sugar transport system permease protein